MLIKKYLVKVNPYEYGEGSEILFNDLSKAIDFIKAGLEGKQTEFSISILKDLKVNEKEDK